ncbi:MAG TPA: Fic family protein, partial [archaeon]|nr:Fic family protein [archaeon]
AAHRAERKRMPSVVREKEDGGFAVRFTYDTQRIEGSKLTLRETADLLERGVVPLRKPLADVNEAEAHRRVFEAALADRREVTLARVLEWHRLLFGETKPGIAGKVREHRVMIARSDFEPPTPVELGPLLRDFFRWWARSAKMHPVERAALAHLKLVTIHPFADGNGRISRLLMNVVLERGGYPLLNIRYENRASYYTALERAQVKVEERIFIDWFIKRYVKEHRWYLR